MQGRYLLVYICPESALRLSDALARLHATRGISLLAVDEAHCVSKWGHDFRPKYSQLSTLVNQLTLPAGRGRQAQRVPVMALTATATERVRAGSFYVILERAHGYIPHCTVTVNPNPTAL